MFAFAWDDEFHIEIDLNIVVVVVADIETRVERLSDAHVGCPCWWLLTREQFTGSFISTHKKKQSLFSLYFVNVDNYSRVLVIIQDCCFVFVVVAVVVIFQVKLDDNLVLVSSFRIHV